MSRPDKDVAEQIAIISRMYPDVATWLREWKNAELERLPMMLNNTAMAQGRCQVLTEICKIVDSAHDTARGNDRSAGH